MPRPIRPSRLEQLLHRSRTNLAPIDIVTVCDQLRDWTASVAAGAGLADARVSGSTSDPCGHADPTGNAALLVADDYAAGVRARIEHHVLQIDSHAASLAKLAGLVTSPPEPPDPAGRGLVLCANVHDCPDDAWAVKAGRCEACYRWRLRHDGMDRRRSGQPRVEDEA